MFTPLFARRFWDRVQKQDGDGCWEWQGARTIMHYGYLSTGRRNRTIGAHRVSWTLTHGAIPDGMCVLHRCDNPPCVRPSHLFLGSQADNVADMVAKGRQHYGENTGGVVLTDGQVGDILKEYATRARSVLSLAEQYGVEEATLRAIVNGQTWTHVEGPRLSRSEIVALGKKQRAIARCAAKRAAGWPPGACSVCGVRGHYKPRCPQATRGSTAGRLEDD